MAFWMCQLLLLVTMTTMVYSTITLGKTSWGSWGAWESCNKDTVVNGFRLQVEEAQGFFGDDTAMTGIQLHCSDGKILTSKTLSRGYWRAWRYCPEYATVNGINFRSERNQGAADDTGANNMNLYCIGEDNQRNWISGGGHAWGDWDSAYCPTGQRVCSMRTLVEPHQGAGDDSALNQIQVNCCELPML